MEVPEVNPANGSTNDVIAAVRFSVQCAGVVPGAVQTIMFSESESGIEFTYVGLSRGPTSYEKGDSPIVSKLTSEVLFHDVAYAENVPADKDSLDDFSLPVTASIATTAMKEWLVTSLSLKFKCVIIQEQVGLILTTMSTGPRLTLGMKFPKLKLY